MERNSLAQQDAQPVSEETLLSRRNVSLLATLAAGHSVVHWFTMAFPVLLAEVVTSLGLGPLAAGAIVSARRMSGAASIIPLGMLADRYASMRTLFMTTALVWFGVGYFLVGISSTRGMLIASAAVLGVGAGLWHPPAIGMLSTTFPQRRASVMAIHGVGASLGDIVGPLVVGVLLVYASWQGIFRFSLLPALVLAVLFFVAMRGASAGVARGNLSFKGYFSALRQAAQHRPLLISISAGAMRQSGQVLLLTFVPIYARDQLELGPEFVGVFIALLMGLSLVSQPILAYISDRTSRKAAILPGAIILTVFTPMLAFATSELAVFALVTVIGLFLFSTSILLGAYGLDIAPPELHSSTTAAQFMVGMLLGSIAPLTAGVLATLFGIESVFFLAAGFFAVTLGLVLLLPSTKSSGHTPRFAAG